MAKKKGRNKKGKKGSGKPPKKSPKVTKLKAPDKKGPDKKSKKGKKKAAAEVPTGDIDLSSVMITELVRNRICSELKLTPQETGYITKVITSVWMAADIVQQEPIGNSDSPLMPARTGENRTVDLGTLAKVVSFPELQHEIRSVLRQARRASFVGPKGLAVLERFVDKAKKIIIYQSPRPDHDGDGGGSE